MSDYVLGLLMLVLILMAAYVAHKVRRIHIQGFEILAHAEIAHRESSQLFSQMQALVHLERLLSLPLGLPALRDWAGSPDFLLHLSRHVLSAKPQVVAECSSGASTVVLARCLQINGSGHVYSLEHDKHYADRTRQLVEERGLSEWATVIHAPLAPYSSAPSPWYDLSTLPAGMQDVELLVIDGPPNAVGPMARYPALTALKARLAGRFDVFLDDADRPEEKKAIQRWMSEDAGLAVELLPAEKGLAVLRRR